MIGRGTVHVLVIGGNRFVGRLLVWRLLAAGHRATLFNRGHIADPFGERVERLVGDRTGPVLERLLEGRTFDAVVDMAAFSGDDGRRAAALLEGRTRHYVMVSTGQVYLVREGCPHPAREPVTRGATSSGGSPRSTPPSQITRDASLRASPRGADRTIAAASLRAARGGADGEAAPHVRGPPARPGAPPLRCAAGSARWHAP